MNLFVFNLLAWFRILYCIFFIKLSCIRNLAQIRNLQLLEVPPEYHANGQNLYILTNRLMSSEWKFEASQIFKFCTTYTLTLTSRLLNLILTLFCGFNPPSPSRNSTQVNQVSCRKNMSQNLIRILLRNPPNNANINFKPFYRRPYKRNVPLRSTSNSWADFLSESCSPRTSLCYQLSTVAASVRKHSYSLQ